jgi:aminodeoxychorismate lyase
MNNDNFSIIYCDGRFYPADQPLIPVHDRSFLYGDGLFESVLVHGGEFFRWEEHFQRLQYGLDLLRIKFPISPEELRTVAGELVTRNGGGSSAMLRIQVSRGSGLRGYSPQGANHPRLVLSLHSLPSQLFERMTSWKLATSSLRLPVGSGFAGFKHCNKLIQIMAKAEAQERGADEPLLLNTNDEIAETAAGNVFWLRDQTLFTPALESGILPGITRSVILEICAREKISVIQSHSPPAALQGIEGMFVSLSSLGVVQVAHLDGQPLAQSSLTLRFWEAYRQLVRG